MSLAPLPNPLNAAPGAAAEANTATVQNSHVQGTQDPGLESAGRVRWLQVALPAGMLAGMLLSVKLWLSARAYPHAPVADWLPAIPSPADTVWFAALLTLLVAIAVLPRPRVAIWSFVALAGLLCLWDQSRLQPWFYQYLFMLAALGFAASGEPARRQLGLNACRVIVAGIYFWSGVEKANFSFAHNVFPWMMEPILPASAEPWLPTLALFVPAIEACIGLGLLMRWSRNLAVVLALAMHGMIMWSIGPLGHGWNTVVWPWNVAMPLFVVILFFRTPHVSLRSILWGQRSAFFALVVVLFALLPGLGVVGWWDAYLSAALYSGNTLRGDIEVSRTAFERLPLATQERCGPIWRDRMLIDFRDWSLKELNVPAYPARRVFRSIARQLYRQSGREPSDILLLIEERPDWLTGERRETPYDGSQL